MTNHSESTGSFDSRDVNGQVNDHIKDGPSDSKGIDEGKGISDNLTAYVGHGGAQQVTLRTPAELADALPYLLGYRPEDSIVLVALYDKNGRGRLGGRARLGIPTNPQDWPSAAKQLADGLVTGSRRRGRQPEQMVAYVCQEPAPGETGQDVMNRLRELAQHLRVECGLLDVPVIEALCVSDGRFWSYCCSRPDCCPPDGVAMGLPGTSVLAAAATYAGLQVRGTLRELRARLLPLETAAALEQERELDKAGLCLVPRILDDTSRASVAAETVELAERVMHRFTAAPKVSGTLLADLHDDEQLTHKEAAALILGIQDRTTRDRVAEWMEGDEAAPALRLWRALARRCVGSYTEHAAAPLTLAGWVAWSTGDDLEAREALAMALGADTDYLFARLLHQAVNEGLEPESIRRCLRSERSERSERVDRAERVEQGMGEAGRTGRTGRTEDESASDAEWARQEAAPDPEAPRLTVIPANSGEPSALPSAAPDVALSKRRRRPRPVGGGTSPSHTASPDGRTPGADARRTSASLSRTRPGAPRTRTRLRTRAGEAVGGIHAGADSDQPGSGGSDAEE
ncbi:DUF4192 family protein [Streptomyces sp. NPDC059477]|uniref:DUF4192 domain-containing protein n=1 Tax=Streptomyces sp. NPDC059477 TaxID=3346847 RepID=UPI0036C8032C